MIAYEMPLCKAVIIARCLPPAFVQPPLYTAEIQELLLDSYRVDILRLQHLIGGDLSPWLDGAGVNAGGGR